MVSSDPNRKLSPGVPYPKPEKKLKKSAAQKKQEAKNEE